MPSAAAEVSITKLFYSGSIITAVPITSNPATPPIMTELVNLVVELDLFIRSR